MSFGKEEHKIHCRYYEFLPVVNETRDEQKFIILEYVFLVVEETSPTYIQLGIYKRRKDRN